MLQAAGRVCWRWRETVHSLAWQVSVVSDSVVHWEQALLARQDLAELDRWEVSRHRHTLR